MTISYQQIPTKEITAKDNSSILMSALAFLIPISMSFDVNVVGKLLGSDIFCLLLFPFILLPRGCFLKNYYVRIVIILGLLYLFSQVLTDLVRETPFHDYARGWAKISIFFICFCTIVMVIGFDMTRIVIFFFGIVVSGFLAFFFHPNPFAKVVPWKFGIGPPVTLLLIILSVLLRKKKLKMNEAGIFIPFLTEISYLLLFLAGALNLFLGSRTSGGMCWLLLGLIVLQKRITKRKFKDIRLSTGKIVFMLIAIFAMAILILNIYKVAAREGWLGEKQRRKYEVQASGKYGLLIGGRPEILVSLIAIKDSPLLGHGSWARDRKYVIMLAKLRKYLGYKDTYYIDPKKDFLIPTHSYLFGAWVEAGLLGAIFWGWALVLAVRAGFRSFIVNDPNIPLILFYLNGLIWRIIFSPFGAKERIYGAFGIVLAIDVLTRYSTYLDKGK